MSVRLEFVKATTASPSLIVYLLRCCGPLWSSGDLNLSSSKKQPWFAHMELSATLEIVDLIFNLRTKGGSPWVWGFAFRDSDGGDLSGVRRVLEDGNTQY